MAGTKAVYSTDDIDNNVWLVIREKAATSEVLMAFRQFVCNQTKAVREWQLQNILNMWAKKMNFYYCKRTRKICGEARQHTAAQAE